MGGHTEGWTICGGWGNGITREHEGEVVHRGWFTGEGGYQPCCPAAWLLAAAPGP
jgi:hypothetical protein